MTKKAKRVVKLPNRKAELQAEFMKVTSPKPADQSAVGTLLEKHYKLGVQIRGLEDERRELGDTLKPMVSHAGGKLTEATSDGTFCGAVSQSETERFDLKKFRSEVKDKKILRLIQKYVTKSESERLIVRRVD